MTELIFGITTVITAIAAYAIGYKNGYGFGEVDERTRQAGERIDALLRSKE